MTPEDHANLPSARLASDGRAREMLDPSQVPDDARHFRSRAVPAPFAEFGAAHCVSLLEHEDAGNGSAHEYAAAELPPTFGRAVRSRVRSHLAGRHCASRAIAQLTGTAPDALQIPIGHLGAPVWPDGVSGSITHSAEIAAAVVAPAGRWRGVGIDCERIMDAARADEIAHMIVPEASLVHFAGPDTDPLPWGTFVSAVFSTKESVYKCLAPLTGAFFDFPAVRVEEIDAVNGRMRLRVVEPLGGGIGAGLLLTGRFCVEQGHVFSAVGLPPA